MVTPKLLYLAYGSNPHPVRLMERVPSAHAVGVTSLPNLSLNFHKRSKKDGSGKCSFTEVGTNSEAIWCAAYELNSEDKIRLDRFEGLGYGYIEQQVDFKIDGEYRCGSIYRAESEYIDTGLRPYQWYKDMVLLGAYYHRLPEEYVDEIAKIEAVDDPDIRRAAHNEKIVENMRNTNLSAGRKVR